MVIARTLAAARRLARGLRADLVAFQMAIGPAAPRHGLHAYRLGQPGRRRWVHLRLHGDGSAVLLVDATLAVHLNRTGAGLARLALEGVPRARALAVLERRFGPAADPCAARECGAIFDWIERLASQPGCPAFPRAWLTASPPAVEAPYKADLALGYACNNACGHCYNPPERRRMASLATGDWRRVLRRLRAVGVAQIIFTGGEPTLRPDLVELVRCAGRLGLVAGMNTNGRRLAEAGFADRLAHAGLDHVQITLESCRPDVHNRMTGADSFDQTVAGVRRALAAGLHTITNTTLTAANVGHAAEIVEFLDRLGLRTFAANGMIHAGCGRAHAQAIPTTCLAPALLAMRGRALELGLRMLWYTPTEYCRLSPLELELGPRRCNAGEASICVEPNGDVLPCQSYYQPAGNLLVDPWERIWNSPLLAGFRRRRLEPQQAGLPERCWDCAELAVCGGGCPLERTAAGCEAEIAAPRA